MWWLSIGHAFRCGASLQAMHSGEVPRYQPWLLVCCLTIGHDFWCCTSLSTMPIGALSHYRPCLLWVPHYRQCLLVVPYYQPCLLVRCLTVCLLPSGVVPHYQPCLLVCCLTIGHAFWCGASLSTMPVGVVPHYNQCLLVWYFTLGHAFWSIATAINVLLVECRWKNGGHKSGATCQRCHYVRHVWWSGATLRYACLYNLTISDMHAGFMNSSTHVRKVLLYQARYLVCYKSFRHAYRQDAAPTWL